MGSFGARATILALFAVGISGIVIYVVYLFRQKYGKDK